MRKNWTFLTLLALAALLLFANLGKPMLWQDEASTALISRTLFTSPLPLGTDGRNSFSQEMGAEFGPDHVWRWQPWLPFYVLAAFFKIFGQSTFVARFPFAFFGWLTVAGTMALARDLWLSRRASLMAGALLTLDIRTCPEPSVIVAPPSTPPPRAGPPRNPGNSGVPTRRVRPGSPRLPNGRSRHSPGLPDHRGGAEGRYPPR